MFTVMLICYLNNFRPGLVGLIQHKKGIYLVLTDGGGVIN